MAAKKKPLTGAELVKQKQIDDHVARTRKGNPKWDARGIYVAQLRGLADETGLHVGDLLDDWGEFAAVQMYDAGMTVDVAERLALEHVSDLARRQRKLAV